MVMWGLGDAVRNAWWNLGQWIRGVLECSMRMRREGGAWVRCGREGTGVSWYYIYRAACGSVVICMEGVGREVGDGVVTSVGGRVVVWRVTLSVSMTMRAGVVDVLMA